LPTSHNSRDSSRQKRPEFRQHFLKAFTGTARARVVTTELLDEFLVAMHDAGTSLDMRLGGITLVPLARDLKTRTPQSWCVRMPYESPFFQPQCSFGKAAYKTPDGDGHLNAHTISRVGDCHNSFISADVEVYQMVYQVVSRGKKSPEEPDFSIPLAPSGTVTYFQNSK
jgi:hypothetical protein